MAGLLTRSTASKFTGIPIKKYFNTPIKSVSASTGEESFVIAHTGPWTCIPSSIKAVDSKDITKKIHMAAPVYMATNSKNMLICKPISQPGMDHVPGIDQSDGYKSYNAK